MFSYFYSPSIHREHLLGAASDTQQIFVFLVIVIVAVYIICFNINNACSGV